MEEGKDNELNTREAIDKHQESLLSEKDATFRELTGIVSRLVDALDVCAGDPLDCPHCGPIRAQARSLLDSLPLQSHSDESAEGKLTRLDFTGWVGANPTFRTSSGGSLVGRFPIVVHSQDQSTWYSVLAFNKRASELRKWLRKGNAVRVTGYPQDSGAEAKSSGRQRMEEVYAIDVRALDEFQA